MTPLSLGIFASANSPIPTDFQSISTVTVGAGGVANVEFTSIPTTYTHLQIRASVKPASTGWIVGSFNNNTTAGTGQRHFIYGDGTAVSGWSGSTSAAGLTFGYGYGTGNFVGMVIDILDYQNTNKNKTVRSLSGVDNNGTGNIFLVSSVLFSTSAITSIKISSEPGNINQYSTFALYGIKGPA